MAYTPVLILSIVSMGLLKTQLRNAGFWDDERIFTSSILQDITSRAVRDSSQVIVLADISPKEKPQFSQWLEAREKSNPFGQIWDVSYSDSYHPVRTRHVLRGPRYAEFDYLIPKLHQFLASLPREVKDGLF